MSAGLTLGQAWRAARDRLARAGIDNPALDARLLAENAFGLTRLALATDEARPADAQGLAALDALVARRLAGEPIARIFGEKEFYGLAFALNEATLVPRPETELLVDKALDWLKGEPAPRVLDLGTGTGCIPIAILVNAPAATAVATDLSPRALEAARENARRHGVAERMVLLEGSWFEPLSSVSAATSPHPSPPLQGEGIESGLSHVSAKAEEPKPPPLE
ncbi:N5-glutamine methyltransferase family protein, partial [Devosia geojensis]|uniref:N5-glutamine methyltransferase family protein n=1 Tax=Devosia geojensis TaxID=443610 RepID=UPI00313A44C2